MTTSKATATAVKPQPKPRTRKKPVVNDVTLPANQFAAAWRNVTLAATGMGYPISDEVMIQVFDPNTIRLIATDAYLALWSTIGKDGSVAPKLDAKPSQEVAVLKSASLMTPFARWISKEQVDTITIRVGPDQVEFDGGDQIVKTNRSRTDWPDILHVAQSFKGEPTKQVSFGPLTMPRLYKIRNMGAVQFKLGGPMKPTMVTVDSDPRVDGLIMPTRQTR